MIKLGQRVRDRVTNFEGIAISKLKFLNGCVQFCVIPKKGKDVKYPEGEYIDVGQLEIVDDGINVNEEENGGVMQNMPRDRYPG